MWRGGWVNQQFINIFRNNINVQQHTYTAAIVITTAAHIVCVYEGVHFLNVCVLYVSKDVLM